MATANSKRISHILYFCDYQDASLDDWNLSVLHNQITVTSVSRQSIRKRLAQSTVGKLYYFLAMRNLFAPDFLKKALLSALKVDCPNLVDKLRSNKSATLFVFNDRNKMSRLFRLLTQNYQIIEDGEANYSYSPRSLWRSPFRLLVGLHPTQRYFGESRRCKIIWAQHPERLPEKVRAKGKAITFLHTPEASEVFNALFEHSISRDSSQQTVVIATQPLERFAIRESQKLHLYERMADYFHRQGCHVLLKAHPAEHDSLYNELYDYVDVLPGKIPLEALLVSSEQKVVIVSLGSSAGLGFETYCKRVILSAPLNPDEFDAWLSDPGLLETDLIHAISAANDST